MAIFDHLGITVDDVARSTEQFHPVMEALGFTKYDAVGSVPWHREGETELILFPAREPKLYPRFNDRYYASFVEDDNGIRIEFMYNPPRDTLAQT